MDFIALAFSSGVIFMPLTMLMACSFDIFPPKREERLGSQPNAAVTKMTAAPRIASLQLRCCTLLSSLCAGAGDPHRHNQQAIPVT